MYSSFSRHFEAFEEGEYIQSYPKSSEDIDLGVDRRLDLFDLSEE